MYVIVKKALSFVLGDQGQIVSEGGKPKLFENKAEAEAYFESMADGATLASLDCFIREANALEIEGEHFIDA